LGKLFTNGDGVNQSDVEAAHWYEKAAKQGDVRVQFRMGILYKEGRGVAQFMVAQVDYHIRAEQSINGKETTEYIHKVSMI
jgi:TPR repeat protein